MKKFKYRFDYIKNILLIISLTYSTLAIAFNTESAMLYNFGHKIAAQPSPKKALKISKASKKRYSVNSKIKPAPIPNIPKSKTSVMLQSPLVLKETKPKTLPVKITPQFGSVAAGQTVNSDYLYNGLSNSNISFDYNSTAFTFSQNSMNITYPLDKKHK